MKLKDIEVGMTVVDKFGNEYIVEQINGCFMPILLKCTKFVKCIGVQENNVMFDCVGQSFWIYKSFKKARKDGSDMCFCITVKSLKPILEKDYLTSDNVKLGMKVIDGIGNEYVVIDFGSDDVKLVHNTQLTSMDGESKEVDMYLQVPYYSNTVIEGECTTKDFQIVKG